MPADVEGMFNSIARDLRAVNDQCVLAVAALSQIDARITKALGNGFAVLASLHSESRAEVQHLAERTEALLSHSRRYGEVLAILETPTNILGEAFEGQAEHIQEFAAAVETRAQGASEMLRRSVEGLAERRDQLQQTIDDTSEEVKQALGELIDMVDAETREMLAGVADAFEDALTSTVEGLVDNNVSATLEELESDVSDGVDQAIEGVIGQIGTALDAAADDLFGGNARSAGERDTLQSALDTLDPALRELEPLTDAVQNLASIYG